MNIKTLSEQSLNNAIMQAVSIVKGNLKQFTYDSQFHSSENNFYKPCDNNLWTTGFWPGAVWLSYELTHDPIFKYAAQIQVQSFKHRIENLIEVEHHDMGFLYTPSCVSAWMLTKDEDAKKAAILAADQLCTRYQPVGEFIQAWGEKSAPDNYRYIIDCLMNVPLLYWAYDQTGDKNYLDIALKHTETTYQNSVREDGSTYHTFFMDMETGAPSYGSACQGYKDDSTWARGQAWGIYGFALAYRYTKDAKYLDVFERVLKVYLEFLPEDQIPYWDLTFTDGSSEPRDSSSAAITACGLLEMADLVEESKAKEYRAIARSMIQSLIDNYAVADASQSNGLLLHGTYSKKSPYNTCTEEGVDECVSWGDYFYLEALTRLTTNWNPYW
ncbi:glycoside hydrolase family 88 protein [Vibrio sp. C8]